MICIWAFFKIALKLSKKYILSFILLFVHNNENISPFDSVAPLSRFIENIDTKEKPYLLFIFSYVTVYFTRLIVRLLNLKQANTNVTFPNSGTEGDEVILLKHAFVNNFWTLFSRLGGPCVNGPKDRKLD